jgi:hypothetical protein
VTWEWRDLGIEVSEPGPGKKFNWWAPLVALLSGFMWLGLLLGARWCLVWMGVKF